ncbi:MAG: class I SAM-dependent methyltransferase [Methanothrix sp.]|nr:class I SAM-dependent methyltransferase [Methanothrix sp.]
MRLQDDEQKDPKKIIAGYWDLRSKSYSKGVTDSRDEEKETWKRCLAPFITDIGLSKALDVGSGTGFLSSLLDDMGVDVTGLDISRGMLAQARDALLQERRDPDLFQGDAEELPFRSSCFDVVASRHLLWTLTDPGKALAQWMRVLRPGGRILVIDGNWFDPAVSKWLGRGLSGLLANFSKSRNPVPFHRFYDPVLQELPLYSACGPERYLAFFEDAGMKNVTLDRLSEANRFYKSHTSLSYRLANANALFLVTGEKGNQ